MATGAYYFAWSNPVFLSAASETVGGMVEHYVDGNAPAAASASSSGSDYVLPLAAIVAGAIVVVLAGGGWYARRRWLR
jgi:cobalamin biosynthesis Mg chelatase CobN